MLSRKININKSYRIFLLWSMIITNGATTTVVTSAPNQSFKEGEVLSFECQIYNLPATDHNVIISREGVFNGLTERIVFSQSDNIFLARRQNADGSIICFLSIKDVTIQDQGRYICQVAQLQGINFVIVAEDFTDIRIRYLPVNPPVCTLSPLTVLAGTTISANCSSESASPAIDLTWRRAGNDVVVATRYQMTNGISCALMQVPVSLKDNNAVFLCSRTSRAFSETLDTCHVGPIMVLPNPDITFGIPPSTQPSPDTSKPNTLASIPPSTQPVSDTSKPSTLVSDSVKYMTSQQLRTDKVLKATEDGGCACSSVSSMKSSWIVLMVAAIMCIISLI